MFFPKIKQQVPHFPLKKKLGRTSENHLALSHPMGPSRKAGFDQLLLHRQSFGVVPHIRQGLGQGTLRPQGPQFLGQLITSWAFKVRIY